MEDMYYTRNSAIVDMVITVTASADSERRPLSYLNGKYTFAGQPFPRPEEGSKLDKPSLYQ
jgi:hypothetical protein